MTTKILLLSASPKNEDTLRVDEEFREINESLRQGKYRDNFETQQGGAIRTKDLMQSLLDYKPNILHFSGHASEAGIYIEGESGNSHLISNDALTGLLKLVPTLNCVILNACYSKAQAKSISEYIPYVIGMTESIGDKAAIKFSLGFYKALVADKNIEQAFKFGCNAIALYGIEGDDIPELVAKDYQ